MYDKHPDVTDEDLGIRAFQIKKAKAVERAIQLIRHGLGETWSELTAEEIEELEWVLGELWAYVARAHWDELHFGHVTLRDVIKILTIGSQLRRHARNNIELLREVDAIVTAESQPSYQLPDEV
jgi:ribosomal protein S13